MTEKINQQQHCKQTRLKPNTLAAKIIPSSFGSLASPRRECQAGGGSSLRSRSTHFLLNMPFSFFFFFFFLLRKGSNQGRKKHSFKLLFFREQSHSESISTPNLPEEVVSRPPREKTGTLCQHEEAKADPRACRETTQIPADLSLDFLICEMELARPTLRGAVESVFCMTVPSTQRGSQSRLRKDPSWQTGGTEGLDFSGFPPSSVSGCSAAKWAPGETEVTPRLATGLGHDRPKEHLKGRSPQIFLYFAYLPTWKNRHRIHTSETAWGPTVTKSW